MSEELVKNLSDPELICYVCKEEITPLKNLRHFFNSNRRAWTAKEIQELMNDANYSTVSVTSTGDTKQTFRHINCDFKNRIFTEMDL